MSSINNISIYIPHVFANYSKEAISKVFNSFIGDVKNVDLIAKIDRNGKKFNAVYVHFNSWYDNVATRNFQQRILDPNLEAIIVYEDPWHWICLENKTHKVKANYRKPRIDLGDLYSIPESGFITPPAKEKCVQAPNAPIKSNSKRQLVCEFTHYEITELEAAIRKTETESIYFTEDEIADLEQAMEYDEYNKNYEDQFLVYVDSRYIREMEKENNELRNKCEELEMRLLISP
jgi:hypothetical protein